MCRSKGRGKEVDGRSDIFSLGRRGRVLYGNATGGALSRQEPDQRSLGQFSNKSMRRLAASKRWTRRGGPRGSRSAWPKPPDERWQRASDVGERANVDQRKQRASDWLRHRGSTGKKRGRRAPGSSPVYWRAPRSSGPLGGQARNSQRASIFPRRCRFLRGPLRGATRAHYCGDCIQLRIRAEECAYGFTETWDHRATVTYR